MAKHGSKKWIKDATGRVKRSTDRTKKDYYTRIKYWEEYVPYSNHYARWRNSNPNYTGEFCPQCKALSKHEQARRVAQERERDRLKEQYNALYSEARELWKVYNHRVDQWIYVDFRGRTRVARIGASKKPKMPEPPDWWDWYSERRTVPHSEESTYYRDNQYLCLKHKRWAKEEREMWYANVPGVRENMNVGKRLSRAYYRAEVKNKMHVAKQYNDYEGYDEILPRRKEYLD